MVAAPQWAISPDGGVHYSTHFLADYSIGMRLDMYPFDRPYFIATRRSAAYNSREVNLNLVQAGFTVPQSMDGWSLVKSGGLVCNLVAVGAGDVSRQCDEAAPACTDVAVMWFQLERDSNYQMQNELAPIVLVTILSAAAYYNDLDATDSRATIMATSLLSMMALQAYVAGTLPATSAITYVHCALYTSYALMGFGVFYIVVVAVALSEDIDAAKLLTNDGMSEDMLARVQHARKRRHAKRVLQLPGGKVEGVKHWMMRLYYDESAEFARILAGGAPGDDLIFYPAAPSVARASSHRPPESWDKEAAGGGDTGQRKDNVQQFAEAEEGSKRGGRLSAGGSGAIAGSVDGTVDGLKDAVKCPEYIWLRSAVIELDLFMRFGHLAIFGAVLLFRYAAIKSMPDQSVTCDNLLDFFAPA